MRPFNLQEFAEGLRVSASDFRTADFADEFLDTLENLMETIPPAKEYDL